MEKNLGIVYNKSPKWDSNIHARKRSVPAQQKTADILPNPPAKRGGKQNRRTA